MGPYLSSRSEEVKIQLSESTVTYAAKEKLNVADDHVRPTFRRELPHALTLGPQSLAKHHCWRSTDCYPWVITTCHFASTSPIQEHISLPWAVSHMAPMAPLPPLQLSGCVCTSTTRSVASANQSADMLFNGEGEAFNVGLAISQQMGPSLTPA